MSKDIHLWFGLTYANYLVLRRSILQSMPLEWQHRFTSLLDELEDACLEAGIEDPPKGFTVKARNADGQFMHDPYAEYRHAPNVFGSRR